MHGSEGGPRIVLLGTYDLGKPRTRMLRRALREIDPQLVELHADIWRTVPDKSVMNGFATKALVALKALAAYPVLATRYLTARRHDVVVIGYLGLFDVLLLGWLARLRGKPLVWDAFLSAYDTYARDRAIAPPSSMRARLVRGMERLACRIANTVVMDTKAHAELMARLHDMPEEKMAAVPVGAEAAAFRPVHEQPREGGGPPRLLFYGQFIPLHGLDTIVSAALSERGKAYRWTIIGDGQEAGRIDARLSSQPADHIERIRWVRYDELQDAMQRSDVVLGIFGTSEKAGSVVPNKVYQAMQAGMPLITRDSPAMRELVGQNGPAIALVAAGDAEALLDGIDTMAQNLPRRGGNNPHADILPRFAFPAIRQHWQDIIASVARRR